MIQPVEIAGLVEAGLMFFNFSSPVPNRRDGLFISFSFRNILFANNNKFFYPLFVKIDQFLFPSLFNLFFSPFPVASGKGAGGMGYKCDIIPIHNILFSIMLHP